MVIEGCLSLNLHDLYGHGLMVLKRRPKYILAKLYIYIYICSACAYMKAIIISNVCHNCLKRRTCFFFIKLTSVRLGNADVPGERRSGVES